MVLAPLPLDSETSVIIDWLEFQVLSSEYKTASISALQREWDKRRNTEESDFEESTSTEEDFLLLIQDALRERIKVLRDSYPFRLSSSGESVELSPTLSEHQYAYLLCLFLSNSKKGLVLSGKYLPNLTNRVRDLFQVCATLAAAGIARGPAISFGFPRPDRSKFLTKMKQIYPLFGEGTVVTSVPPGAPPEIKDGGVDVIAWKTRRDGGAGKFYLLGQVASGHDWPGKSIKATLDLFHDTWFTSKPASTPTPAMFVPFCVVPTSAGESMSDRLIYLTREFGNYYYRYLIAPNVKRGLAIAKAANPRHPVERADDYPKVVRWVQLQLKTLRKRAGHKT